MRDLERAFPGAGPGSLHAHETQIDKTLVERGPNESSLKDSER